MIFDLISDFASALEAMPREHRQRRMLTLVDEAVRRDVHFIYRHREDYPQAMFQCLWNRLWWHDVRKAAAYYCAGECRWPGDSPPWETQAEKLHQRVEAWLRAKEQSTPDFYWIRSLRPPDAPLGSGQGTTLVGHSAAVLSVACFHLDDRVASASADGTIRIWNRATGIELRCIRGHEQAVTGVVVSADDLTIISSSLDGSVRTWNPETGECLDRVDIHNAGLTCLALSADGRLFAAGAADGSAYIWSVHDRCERSRVKLEFEVLSIALSPDGKSLACGTSLYAYHFAAETGEFRYRQSSVRAKVHSIAISHDGQLVVAGGEPSSGCVIWKLGSGREQRRLIGNDEEVIAVAFSQDGGRIVTCSADRSIRIWDAETAREVGSHWVPEVVTSLAVSNDGRTMICGNQEGTCRQFALDGDVPVVRLEGHRSRVYTVAYSPDGRYIASTEIFEPTVRVWEGDDGQPRHQLFGHLAHMSMSLEVQASPDGARLLSQGSLGNNARLWDPVLGIPTVRFPPGLKLTDATFSQQGAFLCAEATDEGDPQDFSGTPPVPQHVIIDTRLGCPLSLPSDAVVRFDPRDMEQAKPFHAATEGSDTVISNNQGQRVASFNLPLRNLATPRQGARWAGSSENLMCLIELVGPGIEDERPLPPPSSPLEEFHRNYPVPAHLLRDVLMDAFVGAGHFGLIVEQLNCDDSSIRRAAAESLAMTHLSSTQRQEINTRLCRFFDDCRKDPDLTAANFFMLLSIFDKGVLPAALDGLADPRQSRRLACLSVIAAAGVVAKPHVDRLLDLLGECSRNDDAGRALADQVHVALSRIGLDAGMPMPVLIKALQLGNDSLREDACEILEQLTADDALAVVAGSVARLTELLAQIDVYSRKRITRVLGRLGLAAASSASALHAQLHAPEREVRKITAWALSQMYPEHGELYLAASLLCLDGVERRRTGATYLAKSGADARAVEPLLARALAEDDDETVRSLAAQALANLRRPATDAGPIPARLTPVSAAPMRQDRASTSQPRGFGPDPPRAVAAQPHPLADPGRAAAFNQLVHHARKLWTTHRTSLRWWQRFRCPPPPSVSDDGTGAGIPSWERRISQYKQAWGDWSRKSWWHRLVARPPTFPDQ